MARRPIGTEVSLPASARVDIGRLVGLVEKLPAILQAAQAVPVGAQIGNVLEQVSNRVGIPTSELRGVFLSLENLRSIAEENGSTAATIRSVASALGEDVGQRLDAEADKIAEVVDGYAPDNPVSLSFKANRLTFNRERLFHDIEVIADVRPVFKTDARAIAEFVVTHTLVVVSSSNGKIEKLHFSLDNADIIRMRKACDRALLKAETLRAALAPVFLTEVFNDEADD